MRLNKLALLTAPVLMMASCAADRTHPGDEGHGHEDHALSATVWSGGKELFAKFHPPVSGEETEFTIYLTRLEDFRPVIEGKVSVTLRGGGGTAASGSAEQAAGRGVWIVGVEAPDPGAYELVFTCEGEPSSVFEAGTVMAFATEEEAELAGEAAFRQSAGHGEEDEHSGAAGTGGGHDHGDDIATVAFLKEQQWNTEFMVEEIPAVMMRSSVPAVAEVLPRQSGYAEIIAPVQGSLSIDHNREMAAPGELVLPGDPLVTICPPVDGSGSWIERQLAYEQARQEFERAGRLLAREAISQRDYDEIRKEWLVEKVSYETILQGVSAEPATDSETGEVHIVLKAPLGGIVASVGVMPGQNVSAGQRIMTIVDPSVVWLRADMFEKDYYRMGTPMGADLLIPGMDVSMRIQEKDLRRLSGGGVFDRGSMTIPVIFETENPAGLLKIGQIVQMDIYTSEETAAVAVPEKSIIDEDYARYVYVQRGGESFEKRAVVTGARSGGLVEIISGLAAGERVVTRGAYSVKLASSKRETGGAHVH